jgi:hypothetical protein
MHPHSRGALHERWEGVPADNASELTSDLQSKLTPGKQRFPLVTLDQFDLSRDRRLLVMPTSPGYDSKGLLDLRRM